MLLVHTGVRKNHPGIRAIVVSRYHTINIFLLMIQILGIADPGSVELTDDEVVALVQEFGFDIVHRSSGIEAPYIQDKQSMLQNTYIASHWVARKR